MAKTNISFNEKNYNIDESALSTATSALQSHFSTVMNGTGATIKLGGQSYGIDATKLSAATNQFVTHLGTIAGTGSKVKVGGVEYGIGTDKVSGAVSELETHWGNLNNPDAPSTDETLEGDGQEFHKFAPTALTFRSTAPLNELQEVQINGVTVDPSNYTTEEGSTIITLPIEYLETLDVDNYEITVVSDSKSAKGGFSVVQPELNEYGFYYNQPYMGGYVGAIGYNMALFMRNDGTMDIVNLDDNGVGTCDYVITDNTIEIYSPLGTIHATASSNGMEIHCIELAHTFNIGDECVVSDNDYIYIYNKDLDGYEVDVIDKTKAEYGAIKSGINGIETIVIRNFAFKDCSSLTSVTIPDSVTSIGSHAFYGCTSLTNINIPDGVTSIGNYAFNGCTSLTNVAIPDSVISIYDDAFYNCTGLTSIDFAGTIAQWNAISKGDKWNYDVPATYVQCSDGQVSLV